MDHALMEVSKCCPTLQDVHINNHVVNIELNYRHDNLGQGCKKCGILASGMPEKKIGVAENLIKKDKYFLLKKRKKKRIFHEKSTLTLTYSNYTNFVAK